jgi:GNAT superfamily N-acetyltransferase
VILALYALAYRRLDQWPGHRVCVPSEIALRERIKIGRLETKVQTHPQRHGSGSGKVLLEAREEIAERALAAAEQRVRMPCLRCPGSRGRIEREVVALEHDDPFEIVGERPRRRQSSHSGANHDRLPANQSRRHHCLSWFILNAAVPLRTQLSFVSPCPRAEREIPRSAKPKCEALHTWACSHAGVVNLEKCDYDT